MRVTNGFGIFGVVVVVAALALFAPATWAQTGTGGSWNYPFTSKWGPLNIVYYGVDMDQPGGGNSGFVGFDQGFGMLYNGVNYSCAWGSLLLIPFYNLNNTNGLPSYSTDINPAAKAMFNQLLTAYALGKSIARVDYYVMTNSPIHSDNDSTHVPCVINLMYMTP
jgi:hypothetical protein